MYSPSTPTNNICTAIKKNKPTNKGANPSSNESQNSIFATKKPAATTKLSNDRKKPSMVTSRNGTFE